MFSKAWRRLLVWWYRDRCTGISEQWFEPNHWRELRAHAEAEHAAAKTEHDRTGVHRWLDASTHNAIGLRICMYCSEQKIRET